MVKNKIHYIMRILLIISSATVISLYLNGLGISKENALMLFMVAVLMISASTNGYSYGIISSIGITLIYNYFFTVPLHTFTIANRNDIIPMVFFLIAALISSNLTVRFQKQLQVSRKNEQTAKLLYRVSERFSHVAGVNNIRQQGVDFIKEYTGFYCEVVFKPWKGKILDTISFTITGIAEPIGVLIVYNNGRKLSMDQELLIKMTANQIGIALDRESLYVEQQAIKISMEKEHLRNSMLRSISHDLRTPLTGIAGASSLILESENLDRESITKLANDINEQATWLIKIVENILNMTRIESDLVIEKREEVIDDIVNEATRHVPELHSHRLFHVTLPEEVVIVTIDGKMMVQVLVNLLDNAVKHTKEGGVITVQVTKENNRVYFYVEDDGAGIDESVKDTLFGEFITHREARIFDGKKGMGLGLAICKAVVEMHGGEIFAENRETGGARFVFWLPITEDILNG